MAVFNCSTYEADEINETVDFNVQTQTNNLYTGGFPVTDTLKIKGINGVNVVARDNTILIGVDGTGSTGGNTDGGNTDGGNMDGSGVDTTLLELSVEALGQRVETLEQSVETLSTDLQALFDRVSDLESGDGTGGGSTGGSTGGNTGGSTGGSGCTCPNIYTANSVEELPDPATVPENSLGLVPSSEKITLKSPNGTVYLITVSDDGEVAAEAV